MEMIVKKQIGNRVYNFVVQGADFHEVVLESEKLSFPDVHQCGLCQSTNLYLRAYVTKEDEYKYTKIVCGKCHGSLTFGQAKKPVGTYYLRKTKDKSRYDWQKDTQKEDPE